MYNITNIEFLPCFNFIDKDKDIEVYRFVEKIIYETDVISEKKLLENLGLEEYINHLKTQYKPKKYVENTGLKRKNIKENMIEDFIIKNKKGKEYMKFLNSKIFLKNIPTKNIIVENNKIIDIIIDA